MRTIVLWISLWLAGACVAQQPGELDTTFADQGKLLIPFPAFGVFGPHAARSVMTIDGSERFLLACGRSVIDSLYLYRYAPDGSIDGTFAAQGKLVTYLDGPVLSVAERGDGHITVVSRQQSVLLDGTGAVIMDHFIDGALDSLLSSTNWTILDAEQDANGLTLLVDTSYSTHFLVRFHPGGAIDPEFGTQGVVQLTSPLAFYWDPIKITLVNGGVAVLWIDAGCGPCVSGYDLRRSIFSAAGLQSAYFMDQPMSGWTVGSAGAFHANPFGTLLSQGQRWGVSWIDNLYFDDDTTAYVPLLFDDLVDVSLGPIGSDVHGNFYVAGTNSVDDGWSIHRFDNEGELDLAFDNDLGGVYQNWSYVQTNFFPGSQAVPHTVLTQVDGKLVVDGTTYDGMQTFIVVARYHAIPDPRAKLDLKLFLGGPMDTNAGLMHDSLRAQGLLPIQQPYLDSTFQSVNGVGAGMTSTTMLNETGAEAAVDWIWLELLDAADTATVVATRAGLLRRNGTVTSPISHDPIDFSVGAGSYFLRVRHRNHLGVTLSDAITLSNTVVSVDLSDPATNTFGTEAQKEVNGVRMLWPGDVNHDGLIRYAGAANDRDAVLVAIGGSPPTATSTGYKDADVNMDGITKYAGVDNDRDVILQSIGGGYPTAVRFEQRP